MYDIVVNADNILMDIYRSLQIVFKEENLNFDPNNVLTGDYNSDLGLIERHMLPFKNMILDFIADPRVYRLAPVDWGLIAYIKNCADKGTRFLIYTISPTKSVQMTKHALFTQWFTGPVNSLRLSESVLPEVHTGVFSSIVFLIISGIVNKLLTSI